MNLSDELNELVRLAKLSWRYKTNDTHVDVEIEVIKKGILFYIPHWISVEERLPNNGQTCIGACLGNTKDGRHQYIRSVCYSSLEKKWFSIDGNSLANVTHWQPQPEPPELPESKG